MHKKHHKIIICVNCKSDLLSFSTIEGSNDKIVNGLITCSKCQTVYPIINGLICLLPAEMRPESIRKKEQRLLEFSSIKFQKEEEMEKKEQEGALNLRGLTVCVFAGASPGKHQEYVEIANKIGSTLGASGANLIYGAGADGIMGAIAKAALAAGGHVTGVLPKCFQKRNDILRDVPNLIIEDNMHHRKHIMYKHADVFLALPGGLGTLDEVIEVLTWLELGLHDKPLILFDINNYWTPFLNLLQHIDTQQLIRSNSAQLIKVVDNDLELTQLFRGFLNRNKKLEKPSVLDAAEKLSVSPFKKAFLLQHLAAEVGFTWPNINSAINKVKEELNELTQEVSQSEKINLRMKEEYSDLLFALINLARYLNVDIDLAVESANQKFIRRFGKLEEQIEKQAGAQLPLERMLAIWNKTKDTL